METRKSLLVIATALIFTCCVFWENPTLVKAMDAKLIKIEQAGAGAEGTVNVGAEVGAIGINPAEIFIKANTAIVWLNRLEKNIRVSFEVPIACQDILPENAWNKKYWDSCYTTTFLSTCETGILVFDKPGVFKYSVLTEGNKIASTGKIVVVGDAIAQINE